MCGVDRESDNATYMNYVGSPDMYDFMGAMQFRLLCALGLRAQHDLLDFGCGSLRAGRLFIAYLNTGRYFGIEPNRWLVDEAVENQIGRDAIRIKRPRFDFNQDQRTDVFSVQFDFIVAQSIFSHADTEFIGKALSNFRESLKADGLAVVTFSEGAKDFDGSGWIYPDMVEYRPSTVVSLAASAGLFAARLPWYHPGQAWYVLAKDRRRLPSRSMRRLLKGAVLHPDFAASWRASTRIHESLRRHGRLMLPEPVKRLLKRLIAPGGGSNR